MENFKNLLLLAGLAAFLGWGCDPVYELRTEPLSWEIDSPPVEVLRITGPTSSFPTLDSVALTRVNAAGPQRLLLMTTVEIPDSSVRAGLYSLPLDSLEGENYLFDTPENGFYFLGLVSFEAGQARINLPVTRPITHDYVYVFGLADPPDLEVTVALRFHRLGVNETPEVEIISLE